MDYKNNNKMTLIKKLCHLGLGSRKEVENIIKSGHIKINGEIVKDLSLQININDKIMVHNKNIINKIEPIKVFLFHKPIGCVTSTVDTEGRKTIFDYMHKKYHNLIKIGRLDYNTEGLLVLTNNGDYARYMELPENKISRTYRVKVFGKVDLEKIDLIKKGVKINGVEYKKCIIKFEKRQDTFSWIKIIVFEGKNKEVRKLMEYCNLKVVRLIRVGYGPYKLLDLKPASIIESKIIIKNFNRLNCRKQKIIKKD